MEKFISGSYFIPNKIPKTVPGGSNKGTFLVNKICKVESEQKGEFVNKIPTKVPTASRAIEEFDFVESKSSSSELSLNDSVDKLSIDNVEMLNGEDLKEILISDIMTILAPLYEEKSCTFTLIDTVVSCIQKFMSGKGMKIIKENVIIVSKKESREKVIENFKIVDSALSETGTDYRRKNLIKNSAFYTEPDTIVYDHDLKLKRVKLFGNSYSDAVLLKCFFRTL